MAYVTEYRLPCRTYKEIRQINEHMVKQLIRKMDKKFGEVSYENTVNFINNQRNTNKDHSIISPHTY